MDPQAPSLELDPGAVQILPGGFWRRFAAVMIDGFIISFIQFPIAFVVGFVFSMLIQGNPEAAESSASILILQAVNYLIWLVIVVPYFGFFYSKKGSSPGKMALKLKVIDCDTGQNLSFARAGLRETFGKLASFVTLYIGFIIAGIRSDKRGLHDFLFNTQVVQVKRG